MITLKELNEFAAKKKLDPSKCVILLHGECSNGDIELDYFQKLYCYNKVEVLNKDDGWDNVATAIGLEKLEVDIDPWK